MEQIHSTGQKKQGNILLMKISTTKVFMLSVALLFFSSELVAEESQGVGEVNCGSFSKKKAYREAIEKAKVSAIRNWIQKYPDDYNNFVKVEGDIYKDLDRYSINPPRAQTYRNKDTGTCRAEVVIDLNVLELKRAFLSSTSTNIKSGLTFVFVAREKTQASNQGETSSGTRNTVQRDMGKASTENTETQVRTEQRTKSNITGSTQYNEKALWRTESVKEIDATVKQEFIRAGYMVAEQAALISASGKQFNPDLIEEGYSTGGDIDSTIINSSIEGLQAINQRPVKYLATAALDVDIPTRDPKTNLYRVTVTVNGKVFDIDSGGFFTAGACSVLGIGEGQNIMTAKFNALKQSASDCSKQMVGQMSGNNIR